MSRMSRAREYVGIFVMADARWRDFVPVDGTVHGDTVRLGDTLMERLDADTWRITAGSEVVTLQRRGAKR